MWSIIRDVLVAIDSGKMIGFLLNLKSLQGSENSKEFYQRKLQKTSMLIFLCATLPARRNIT